MRDLGRGILWVRASCSHLFQPVLVVRPIRRGVHRKFVETAIPLGVRNAGPGFVHYSAAPEGML